MTRKCKVCGKEQPSYEFALTGGTYDDKRRMPVYKFSDVCRLCENTAKLKRGLKSAFGGKV